MRAAGWALVALAFGLFVYTLTQGAVSQTGVALLLFAASFVGLGVGFTLALREER